MVWCVRALVDPNGEYVEEPHFYEGNKDEFSIKLFHGGDLNENCTAYVGGKVDYIDHCNSDEMSYIELTSMCKEVGVTGSLSLYYNFPEVEWTDGLWPLETDIDVLEMCALLPVANLVYVYCTSKEVRHIEVSLTQNLSPTQNYIEDPILVAQFERLQEMQILEMEGIYKDFSDLDDREVEDNVKDPTAPENDE